MIAEDGSDPLGLAHAFAEADGSAEFAVIIADYARRRGVAASLFGRIMTALQTRGITRIVAFSLADNEPFAYLATACGMESEPEDTAQPQRGARVDRGVTTLGGTRAMIGSEPNALTTLQRGPSTIAWDDATLRGRARPTRRSSLCRNSIRRRSSRYAPSLHRFTGRDRHREQIARRAAYP